jgi:chemotaxis protein methyltransferase CheR
MELAASTFRELADFIRAESGITLGPEKSYLLRHRLEPLIRREGLHSFDGLIEKLRSRGRAALRDSVIDAITVKETRFFRDHAYFEALREHVLPACAALLGASPKTRHRIRLWSAATATGQEAYSLAILVREFLESRGLAAPDDGHFSILATDISTTAIESAKSALFSRTQVHSGLSDSRRQRYLHHRGERWIIDEPLRRMVQFRMFNLLHSPAPLGAFDLILCRNVLIYFDEPIRQRICRGLHSVLHDGGWLALGSAESIHGMDDCFETVIRGKVILYRKPPRRA